MPEKLFGLLVTINDDTHYLPPEKEHPSAAKLMGKRQKVVGKTYLVMDVMDHELFLDLHVDGFI